MRRGGPYYICMQSRTIVKSCGFPWARGSSAAPESGPLLRGKSRNWSYMSCLPMFRVCSHKLKGRSAHAFDLWELFLKNKRLSKMEVSRSRKSALPVQFTAGQPECGEVFLDAFL